MDKPHSVIYLPDYFAKNFENLVLTDFAQPNLKIDFRRSKQAMYACLDLAISGLIAANIFKPYFYFFNRSRKRSLSNIKKEIW